MHGNKTYMQKADIQVADLINDGGYLNPEEFKRFLVKLIKESRLVRKINTGPIKSHTQKIPKVGLDGRVLRPGTSGQALPAADRAKPVTDDVELQTVYMKGEIDLNDEVLEDNIEAGTFKQTVRQMMGEQIALDLDDFVANGDTSSTVPLLALQNGMIVSATSHTVNAGTNPIAKQYLKLALKAMPGQYNRLKGKQEFLTSELALVDYRDFLADRGTVYGDDNLRRELQVYYQDRPINSIPVFPDDLGGANNTTVVLLLDPSTAKLGIWRQVRIETERSAREGKWYMIATIRAGFKYIEEDSVVKIYNVLTQ